MSSSFGAPSFESTSAVADAAASPAPSDAPQDILDPNDPSLVSEELNVNVDADAYAQPAPPPDGKWRVKLKHLRPKNAQGQEVDYLPARWGSKNPQNIFVTGVEASIIDPAGKFDGLKAFDFNVSTFVGREHATKVTTLLMRLRQPDGKPWVARGEHISAKLWMDRLVKALAGEPECGIESVWEWSCPDCGKEAKAAGKPYPKALVGMHRFPAETDPAKRKAGQLYSPEVKCQVNAAHGYSRCRITIGRFMSLEELAGKA